MTKPASTHRFYVNEPLAEGSVVALPLDRSLQIAKVLRLRAGDAIVLFDGRGGEFLAKLIEVSPDQAVASTGPSLDGCADPEPAIHLSPALLKADRFDWVVQKAIELGVAAITPVITERAVISLATDRTGRRRERWQRIAIEAAEQCGRTRIPALADPIPFASILGRMPATPALLLWEGERDQGLALALSRNGSRCWWGRRAASRPARSSRPLPREREISLGPLILRSETAAIAGTAMILARFAVEHPDGNSGERQSRRESN